MKPKWYKRKDYPTRFDRFRARENISIGLWASKAGIARSQLNKYRAGTEPRTNTAALLIRAASEILGRPVRASEVFDLGEETPVASCDVPARPLSRMKRKDYPSRLDALIRLLDIPPKEFAQQIVTSRRQVVRLRSQEASAVIGTVRRIVTMMRERGHEVWASDIADFGEGEEGERK